MTWTVFGHARTGIVKTFKVHDPVTGKWVIDIREDNVRPEISVAVSSYPKGRRFYAKGARYTILFKPCENKKDFYSYLSIAQITGNSTSRKIFNKDDRQTIPKWIKSYFRIRLYSSVVPKGTKSPAKNKLVTVINYKKLEDFAKFFIATRIWPLKEHYEKIFG